MDLGGDGIEVSSGLKASFNFDDDEYREAGAWVGDKDGFLVIDRQDNGDATANTDGTFGNNQITRADELVLSLLTDNASDTDLQAVRDSWLNNNDTTVAFTGSDGITRQIQVLDSRDAGWAHLRIWRDLDQDGEVDGGLVSSKNDTTGQASGELFTLDALGITQINLGYDNGAAFSDKEDDITVGLATLHGLGSYVRETDGGGFETISGGVGDMSLGHAEFGWKLVELPDGSGHEYQFETGERWRYAKLAEPGSAAFNLTAGAYDAAQGDARNNDLNATGSARAVQIAGGAGADTLRGGGSDDLLSGEADADSLMGNEGNDLLVIDSNDLVSGFVDGGQGMDTLMVGDDLAVSLILADHAAEAGIGGAGADMISGAGQYGDVRISGKGGTDTLTDGFGDDLLSGDDGNDTLTAAAGDDALFGGAGLDSLASGVGDDQLYGGDAADKLVGSTGDDYLSGGADKDTLLGGEDDDRLFGGGGADILAGEAGDDTLDGGAGNDTLTFWRGDAELWGQAGEDTFKLAYSATPRWGWAVLFGGKGTDTLELDGSSTDWNYQLAKTHVGGNQWQLYRQISSSEKLVIDLIDIEKITFLGADGITSGDDTTIVLGAFEDDDTSEDYQRREWGNYIGDDVAAGQKVDPGYTGGFYSNGILNGWMGNDSLTGWSNVETLDAISGGSGTDTLSGASGADSLMGDTGADLLLGGEGSDTVTGGSGADQVSGGDANDSLVSGSGSDMLWGDDGNDSAYGGSGNDVLLGGIGTDRLYGGSGSDQVSGGAQSDTLYGDTGYDRLYGDEGADQLYGGAGSDYLYGGADNDTLVGDNLLTGEDTLGSGFNYLSGGEGNDSLLGGVMDDQLSGDAGNDTLIGGTGRDVLMGGASADSLDGGTGITDAVSYESSLGDVTVDLATQTASGGDASGATNNDTLAGFEQAIGGAGDDSLSGSGGDNMLGGGLGADRLDGRSGDDDLFGGDGADSVSGGAGVDRLYGGAGNDLLYGGDGADTLDGGEGIDAITFASATAGLVIDLRASANQGAELIDDLYLNIETVTGTGYNDTILGGFEANALTGGSGNDSLQGGLGNDSLYGGDGSDSLQGGEDADLLYGGGGADVLTGSSGRDLLYGGSDTAADRFVFAATSESADGSATRDVLYDFLSGVDELDLSGIDANSAVIGNQAFLWNGSTARANALWYVVSGADVILKADVDGNTLADVEIELKGMAALVAGDVLL
ncbi:Ca2+-binding protein, RTX toxin-related [Gemmobacter aquatilis]|uniref:Ca2+-binding protein, RTX toxin-related n=1 Tax=Gemmobacter aquatilis TaxID=933059 RepID=A0A1H8LSA5_9RHOB|nr:Ca2+-binding protein, RTX toxin-related [Gemmobacter aquatilis]